MTSRDTHRAAPAAIAVTAALAVVAAVCAWAAAPAARAANLASPIRAVFLKEFSRPEYTMVRGQLLVLENSDPFLQHGLSGGITADIADPGKDRLVRNSPYFAPGSYGFFDPLHPEMRATLTVTPGAPPPPDTTPPEGQIKVLHLKARKFAANGRVRVRVSVSEAADVDLSVVDGKKKVATTSAAFADPVTRVVSFQVPEAGLKRLKGEQMLEVRAKITDVVGLVDKDLSRQRLVPKRAKKKKR